MRCMLVVVEGLYHHHEITGEKLSLSYQIIRGQKLSYCNILYTTICCNFGPGQPRPDGRVKLCLAVEEKGGKGDLAPFLYSDIDRFLSGEVYTYKENNMIF